jgi:ABC-type Zn uptake system ZnuABC Zn-binding protein ZnuA
MAACVFLLLVAGGCAKTGDMHDEEKSAGEILPQFSEVSLDAGEKLNVVATTSIVADVVKQVGGDEITLKTLIPLGADPHAFEPTPKDITVVADAHVVFSNGLGLEAFLDDLIANAGKQSSLLPVSTNIHPLESAHEDHEHAEEEDDHGDVDPHTWFDPNNVIVWTQTIKAALQALDPDNASIYEERAGVYQDELENLDIWISEQVGQIPEANRKLVTDHQVFSYFAERYGFEQIGTVVPGYNASAQPSALELADLSRNIEEYAVEAIFVGKTVNPDLAQQIADDMGIQLVFLYTGSLSERDGEAGSYTAFMRYNTLAIVSSLK